MELIQPFAAIVLVMGLLGGALFLLKKRGAVSLRNTPGPRRLEVLERVVLTPQHALHLVRTGDRCVLIATAPSSCQIVEQTWGDTTRGEKP